MFDKKWLDGNTFNWDDLHGKELKILVDRSYDFDYDEETTVVMGYEESSRSYYVIRSETKRG